MSTPSAETVLLYPGDEPSSVALLAENTRAGSRQLTLLSDAITGARSSLQAAWKGEDAAAADREIDTVVRICTALIERVDTAATSVETHYADLLRIRVAIALLREQWTATRSALEALLLPPLFAPAWRPPVPAGSQAPLGSIFDQPMLSDAEIAQQRQAQIGSYQQDLADLQTNWQALVREQEVSAASCQSALDNASSGSWTYLVGTGVTRAELGSALGLDSLVFDDRERARLAALAIPGQGWDQLSKREQAFYRQLATTEFSTPLVLGSTAMIPGLWSDLDPLAQQALIHDQSSMIGNLDGLPSDARDQANRIHLDGYLDDVRADAAEAGVALPGGTTNPDDRKDEVTAALSAAGYSGAQIRAARGALAVEFQLEQRLPSDPTLQPPPKLDLLIFDPTAFDGRGRAAIALGDVSSAHSVAMLVPGMTSEVPGYLQMQDGDAINLYRTSVRLDPTAAVVAYVGYQAPGMDLGVTDQQLSDRGGRVVAADIGGLQTMASQPESQLTVIAHSYGSTTTSTAFADYGAKANNLILIGSPGAGRAQTAADLGLPPGHVFVGSASSDPVTTIVQQAQDPSQVTELGLKAGWQYGSQVGGHGVNTNAGVGILGAVVGAVVAPKAQAVLSPFLGVDPAGENFGAVRIHAETQNDSVYEFGNHSAYYQSGSESLDNLTKVMVGNPDTVGQAEPRPEDGAHYQGTDPETDHVPPVPDR